MIQQETNDEFPLLFGQLMSSISQVYPNAILEAILTEQEYGSRDITRLMVNFLKMREKTHFSVYSSIINAWISMATSLKKPIVDHLVIKRQIVQYLVNNRDLQFEHIYQHTEDASYEHTHGHIMWCFTLVLVRELAGFLSIDGFKIILHFLDAYKSRLESLFFE